MSGLDKAILSLPMPSDELAALLELARAGNIADFDHGDVASAGWTAGQPLPSTLLLDGLPSYMLGNRLPRGFGSDPLFVTVTALDLSANGLVELPHDFFDSLTQLRVFYTGGPDPGSDGHQWRNRLSGAVGHMAGLTKLAQLEDLSFHDTDLSALPDLSSCTTLHTLRLDRCPICSDTLPGLPQSLRTLHLEGSSLPGTLRDPSSLPEAVKGLCGLQDLQMPDGFHVGSFFENPLQELLQAAAAGVVVTAERDGLISEVRRGDLTAGPP